MFKGLSRRNLLQGALASAAFIASLSRLQAKASDIIRIGYDIEPASKTLYPDRLDWVAAGNMVGMCLEPLVRIAGENKKEAVIAKKIYGDDTGMVWYIEINQGIPWQGSDRHDVLTERQVIANLQHWIDDRDSKQLGAGFRAYVSNISLESIPDGFGERIRIDLKSPNFQFFYEFTSYAALIMHPDDNWIFTKESRSTGPFRMMSYIDKKEARYEPVVGYWDQGKRALYPVTFVQDTGAVDQNIDFIPQFSPERGPQLKASGNLVKQNLLADTLVFHMDCRAEILKDPATRQALRACLDGQGIVESIGGYGHVADHTHANPIHEDYPVDRPSAAVFDPEKARTLLKGKSLMLPIYYPGENIWQKTAVEAYVQQAKLAGITLVPTPKSDFSDNWDQYHGGLSAEKWNHRPLAMQLYREVYTSKADWNLSGWSNPEFDRLVEQLYATPLTNRLAISKLMARAMEILQQNGPMVQAAWLDCNKAYNPNRLTASSVEVGSMGFIYANKLKKA